MKNKFKFEPFLRGVYVDLVLLDKNVVKKTDWFKWMNVKENTDLLQTGKFPNTLADQLNYLKNNLETKKIILSNKKIKKKLQLGIVDKKTNFLVGMVTAYDFNYFNRTCAISLITDLTKSLKNRLQIFKESQDLMINHIFFKMNFRKIYSGAISESLSKLTERVWGFKREGVRKEHGFVNGKYVDSYDLSLFRKDWIKNDY